jgi:hypothetical protein
LYLVSPSPFPFALIDWMLSLRDTFRVIHPLYAITAPTAQAEVIRALIDIYRHTGFLPDCRMSLDKGFTQGGSNADSLLADSFVKGITAGIDWQTGFAAMLKDAQVEGDWEVEGRGGIASRDKYGYIPVGDYADDPPSNAGHTRYVSRWLKFDLRIDSLVGVPPAYWNMHTTTSASLSSRRGSTAPRTLRTSSINQATGSTSGTSTPRIRASRVSSSRGTPMGAGFSIHGSTAMACFARTTAARCLGIWIVSWCVLNWLI